MPTADYVYVMLFLLIVINGKRKNREGDPVGGALAIFDWTDHRAQGDLIDQGSDDRVARELA